MVKNCDTCEFNMFDYQLGRDVCASQHYGVFIDYIRLKYKYLFEEPYQDCLGWELSFRLYMSNPSKYEAFLK